MPTRPANAVKPKDLTRAKARAEAAKASLEKKYGKMKKVIFIEVTKAL